MGQLENTDREGRCTHRSESCTSCEDMARISEVELKVRIAMEEVRFMRARAGDGRRRAREEELTLRSLELYTFTTPELELRANTETYTHPSKHAEERHKKPHGVLHRGMRG